MTTLRHKPLFDAIRGDKGGGGGSQHTPTEASDTLRSTAYATILDLVSEGEIKGFALGADKMGQCIALDGTLLESPDGTRNFSNVTVDSRAGTQGQDYIPGVPDVENSLSVGVELKAGTPWVTRITNTNLSAVRIILSVPNGLQKSDQSTGDVTGYTVAYKIEMSIDDGVYATVMSGAFSGKASGKYQRAHRLNLPAADDHWNIRVTRTTANAASAMIADRTDVDAEVDIIDTKFRYPNSALVSISVDASQFSSIPTRAYLLEGRIVRIPSNYDPVSRTYTGVWDGTFKPGYTNNPAWCFFDMATHKRYGLGQFLNEAMVDKWKLYTISQYCDQLVDDGNGGLEPRFTCFLYLQDKADAYKVMQDMATMFRGISYYAGSAIQAVADMPSDPVYAYDDTNVIGGKFSYSGSSRTSRQTVALVSWNDESDFSRAKVEYVEDLEGIARYGVRTTEVTAIGESRRSGAHRAGRHILFTNRLETEMVSFSVGLDGDIAAPGMIVKVTDHSRAGKRMGGRIKTATASVVTVDKMPDVEIGDTLSVNMPDGVLQERTVSGVSSTDITVGTPFTDVPAAEAVWAVEKTSLAAQLFRVVSVAENSETDEVPGFTLSCIQHAPEKFAAIDNGIILAPRPITSLNTPTQAPVTSISIAQNIVYQQGVAITNLTISWDKPAGAAKYSVEWKKDDGGWISAGETTSQAAPVNNVYAGSYQARVIAFGTSGVASVPVVSAVYLIGGKNTKPPAPVLSATGSFMSVDLTWTFPTTANVSDTSYTEVQTDIAADMSAAVVSGTVPYPGGYLNVGGMAPGETKYARARLVDKLGNIGEWSNLVSAAADTTDTLFQPIRDDIDAVQSDVDALRTSVDGQISTLQTEADDTQAQVAALQSQVGDVLNVSAWDVATSYNSGDLATKNGKMYRSLIDANVGNDPETATADWQLIGDYASLGEAVGANSAAISILNNTVTQQGDDITANSQSISDNAAAIGTKASQSALNALSSTVTQQGNTLTSQGQDIGALQGSVTSLDGSVSANTTAINNTYTKAQTDGVATTAASNATSSLKSSLEAPGGSIYDAQAAANDAQSAAQAASNLAGGKGKVIVQSTTPATADRLAQNLWIDTTGNANTPKRWNGTAWVAVTDKVATDAAAAAANALSVANTKLDASVINNYYTKTQTDGNINSAVSSAQTALQANIDTKASTAALNSLSTTVTQQGNDITSNTSAITSVQGSVGDVNSRVDSEISARQSGDAANASAITGVQTSIGNVDSKVNTEISARQSGDAANAQSISVVQARVGTLEDLPANLLHNPNGALGTQGWGSNAGAITVANNQYSGTFFVAAPSPASPVVVAGEDVLVAQDLYTLSADVLSNDGKTIYLQPRWLDSNKNELAYAAAVATSTPNVWTRITTTVDARTSPSNAFLRFYIQCNDATTGLLYRRVKVERSPKATAYTEDTQNATSASVSTQAKATADAVTGKVNASYTLALDVNGKVIGMVAQNNGSVGSIVFNADYVSFTKSNSSGSTNISGGLIEVKDAAGYPLVQIGMLP